METKKLDKQFEKIGSRLKISKMIRRNSLSGINILKDKKGEFFSVFLHPDIQDNEVSFQVAAIDPKLKQMVFVIAHPDFKAKEVSRNNFVFEKTNGTISERFLIGRDERHCFVAGITAANSVKEAFDSLRPSAANLALQKAGVKSKDWRKRKNKGYIRQGEWFFIPSAFQETHSTVIHKNEPISRNGGKPHFVEEIVRTGGEVVYVGNREVLTKEDYELLDSKSRTRYTQRTRGAKVYGRGKVSHPDHYTITLKGWHEIHLSTEKEAKTNAFVSSFID